MVPFLLLTMKHYLTLNTCSPFKSTRKPLQLGLSIPFNREEANLIKIAEDLPVGTRIPPDKARHVLIGKSEPPFFGQLPAPKQCIMPSKLFMQNL